MLIAHSTGPRKLCALNTGHYYLQFNVCSNLINLIRFVFQYTYQLEHECTLCYLCRPNSFIWVSHMVQEEVARARCVQSALTYGNETWAMKVGNLGENREQMVRWMFLKDRECSHY